MSKRIVQSMEGIVTPMITPLLNDDVVDKEGMRNMIEHLLSGGVHGIFVLGTTGEGVSLSKRLQREVVSLACEFVAGRAPVLVGITDPSLQESIELTSFSASAGAAAAVAAPPFYFTLTQQELLAYYSRLADKVILPVFIYNMPAQTKMMIEADTIVKLAEHSNIIGIKDSSGAAPYFNTLLYQLKGHRQFSVFVGPDEMLAQVVLLGGKGGVNSGSNMFPQLFVRLYEAAKHGDLAKTRLLHDAVMEISSVIYSQGSGSYRFLKGIKQVISLLEITGNTMASPLSGIFNKEETGNILESMNRVKQYFNSIENT